MYKCLAGDLSPSSTGPVLGIKPATGPATPICLRSGHTYTPSGLQGEILTTFHQVTGTGGILYTSIKKTEAACVFKSALLHYTTFQINVNVVTGLLVRQAFNKACNTLLDGKLP